MRPWIRCALFVSVFFVALGQERIKTGELKGFIKSPTEHIIERLEKISTLQKVEGLTLNGFRSVVGTIAVQRSLKSSEAGEAFRIYMLSGV